MRKLGPVLVLLALIPAAAASQESVTGPFDPLRFSRLKDFVAKRSSSNNPDPQSNDDSKRPIPGETITLAELEGPGIVTHIWITVAANEYAWPRLLRLRAYYDGSPEPSVDAPIGDFFAVGHGFERPVKSLMVRASSDGRARNSYWPMPFRKSCRITLTNEGRRRVSNVYYHVDWEKLAELPPRTAYFHARYRQALPAPADGKPYVFLDVKGRGFYVGTVLSVVQAEAGWFGEGDEHFFVDGEKTASIEGTGSEDYFNDAWGLHVEDGPYTGVPVADGTGLGSRMTAYRWHLTDPVPFTKSLYFEIEHKGWTFKPDGSVKSSFGERVDLMSSVSFWYQDGIAQGLPPVPYGAARLPQGNAKQIEVENAIEKVRAENGKTSVSRDLFWSKDVILFEGQKEGSKLEIPFDVDEDGDYELYTQLAQASDYGIYTVLLDGKPPAAPVLEHEPGADVRPQTQFDGYAPETYVGMDYQIGWPRLSKGRHTLTFLCLGKNAASSGYNLGVDDIILARTGPSGWAMASAVKAPKIPSGSVADIAKSLDDPDAITRGLAALELRNRKAESKPALDALASKLKDPDVIVRMMSANAIGTMGPEAAGAVPALTAACRIETEVTHVLRACAAALGEIGKAARPALPVLRDLVKNKPLVRRSAERAIEQIEGPAK
jgi:D-arabinan exo alpha-(1,3)/(1,5)-arabinofuranosidase (non-reducing end)